MILKSPIFLVFLLIAGSAIAQPPGDVEPIPPATVEHIAKPAVYVSMGSLQGLDAGDRIEVLREGRSIALLDVIRVTEHTAYCRVLHEFLPIELGDEAVPSTLEELTVTEKSEPLPAPNPPSRLPRVVERERRSSEQLSTSLSGTTFFRNQTRTTDDGETAREWTESTARVSVRARNIGGRPIDFRVRGRARTRARNFGSDDSDLNDQRFYELSVGWEPSGGHSWWQAGRIGSRQETGVGFLDGVAGQFGTTKGWGFGGFAGLNPDVDESLFSSEKTKAGAFVSYATPKGKKNYGEFLLSGIAEYVPGSVNREYLFLQTRFGNRGHWSFYQQAELDLNRGWRKEIEGSDYQLSNLSLSGSFKMTERFRASLSYDARRRYRDYETRDTPEEQFDELLREGYRATLFFRGEQGLNVSVGLGARGGQGDVNSVQSFVGSINHGNVLGLNLFAGIDVSSFSGDASDGYLATFRLRKYIKRGHDLGLTYGESHSSSALSTADLELRWLRVDGTVQLPRSLFLIGEFELGLTGDSETRQMLQLGYRF